MKINEDSQYIKLILDIIYFEQESKKDVKYSPFATTFRRLFPKKDFIELTLNELSQIISLPPFTKEQMNMKIKDVASEKYIKTLLKRQISGDLKC